MWCSVFVLRQGHQLAVARAVADTRVLAELCLPFVAVGGFWVAAKGPNPEVCDMHWCSEATVITARVDLSLFMQEHKCILYLSPMRVSDVQLKVLVHGCVCLYMNQVTPGFWVSAFLSYSTSIHHMMQHSAVDSTMFDALTVIMRQV